MVGEGMGEEKKREKIGRNESGEGREEKGEGEESGESIETRGGRRGRGG